MKYCKYRMMKSFIVQAAIFIVCAWRAAAQPRVVSLNVVATDKQGQVVTGLKAEDFQVQDDGKSQPIVMFRVNDGKHPAQAAPGPHEYTNRPPGTPMGVTVILFDLLNGSFTDREYMVITLVKALAKVESPGNVYLYLLTNDGALYPIHPMPERGAEAAAPDQNWTSQTRPLLEAAIQKVYGFRPVDDRDIGVRVITTFKVLSDLGGQLSALPGRKNVVWITNGFPVQANFGGLCRNIVVWNVTAPCTGNFVDFAPVVRYLADQLDALGVSLYPVDEWNVDGGDRMLVKETLDQFAAMTAGRSYASGGTKEAIPDALQAMHLSYTLAYQPAPKSWDGKYHKVKLTCARKGAQLQFEQGYIAIPPVDNTNRLMQVAAAGNSDLSAIGLRATVTPGAGPHTVRIQLQIDPSSLTIVQQNNRYSGQLAAVYAGLTAEGPKQLAKPATLALDWNAQQYDSVAKDGIPLTEELPTPDGVHRIRMIIVDTRSNQVGSLTVPVK
jgi:VWFA-related protein